MSTTAASSGLRDEVAMAAMQNPNLFRQLDDISIAEDVRACLAIADAYLSAR